ncbi:MAG TPA: YraN family protein [Candidatus Saccharimonadales bacterium]|nr:YraN family protein [Candidatus Saccharimonadales bacterium]
MPKNIIGHFGENLACAYLQNKNYQILERNYHLGHLELDIISSKDGQIFLFEIKTRRYLQTKIEETLISKNQIANLKKAAIRYAANQRLNFNLIHFDLILIILNYQQNRAQFKHYRDIF